MNRRDFIYKTSIAGSSAIASPQIIDSLISTGKKPKSVIIIGAGFAGLSAAYKFVQNEVSVTVLESRNRIGGRVFSHNPENAAGQVIELGAEWVGASHERIISLCNTFGLILDNNQFETDTSISGIHRKDGEWEFGTVMNEFWNKKAALWKNMTEKEKRKLDKTDWWRYLSNLNIDEKDMQIRELLDSTDFGESIRQASAYSAFSEYAESSEKNEMDLKIRGGNGLLAHKFSEAIGIEKIKLNHTVKSIEQTNRKGVKVICDNGSSFEADKIICAIPTFSLLKINWLPDLPSRTYDALQELQYARIGKYPILFSERFWQREDFDMITDTPAHYFYHGTKGQPGKSGVLTCYATGDKGEVLASIDKKRRSEIILEALAPAFGNVKKYVQEEMMYYWGQDKYSSGAYAFYGKYQRFDVMPTLKKSFMHCFFAGEHLADWQGFMEGAINSGEEAADLILRGH